MISSRTPLRISFFGGGTDYPDFYNEHGGEVLVSTIDKYSYIFVKKLSDIYDFNIKIMYSKIEEVYNLDDIEHPSIKNCLKYLNMKDKLDISYMGDLPAKSGLGSSSSFTVGLLNAIHAYYNNIYDKAYYGKQAIYIEQEVIKENVGSQDQISTAVGGFNHIIFTKDDIIVKKIEFKDSIFEKLNNNLELFYYGNNRYSSDILKEQINKTKSGYNNDTLFKMKDNVGEAIKLLKTNKLNEFGELMNYNWELKKKLSTNISNNGINEIYDLAIKNGAIGGKLLGAGSGGFLLFYIPKEAQISKIQNLIKLKRVHFKFESDGTVII